MEFMLDIVNLTNIFAGLSHVKSIKYFFPLITETELTKGLREQYIKNPPEGMTSDEVRDMDDEDLLDMDYFLHEFDDLDDDDFGEEGFYIF